MKALIVLSLVLGSLCSMASDLPTAEEREWTSNCTPQIFFDGDRPVGTYNLVSGIYSSSQKNQGWCSNYKINEILKYSCDGNVSSFFLTCTDSGTNFKVQFKCDRQGLCKAGDAESRTIRLSDVTSREVEYSRVSNETRLKTILTYTGPCE